MLHAKARRGRPKGTGIDDKTRLETIARLLADDPSLKPTTAIKSIGITDPSAIRRLRDKFHEFSSGEAGPMSAAAPDLQLANDALENVSDAAMLRPQAKLGRAKHALSAGPSAARKVERVERIGRAPPLQIVAPTVPSAVPPPASVAAISAAVEAAQRAAAGRASVQTPAPPQASTAAVQPTAAAKSVPPPPADPAAWLMMWSGLGVRLVSTAVEAQLALGAALLRTPPFAAVARNQIAFNEMAMTMFGPFGSKAK